MTFRSLKAWWPGLTWQGRDRGGSWREKRGWMRARRGMEERWEEGSSRWWRWREDEKRGERTTCAEKVKTERAEEKVIHWRGQSLFSLFAVKPVFWLGVGRYTVLHNTAECCIVSLLRAVQIVYYYSCCRWFIALDTTGVGIATIDSDCLCLPGANGGVSTATSPEGRLYTV